MTKTKKRISPSSEAKRILGEFGDKVPIDLHRIFEHYKISVRKHDLEESVSGMLVIKGGHAVVGINESHHPNRQRFTMAHELGHFLLHAEETKVFVDSSPVFFRDATASEGISTAEIEANNFAAEILMPEKFIREQVKKHPIDAFDDVSVRRLASKLQVSVQALTIRLTNLKLL
ncbi:MAG: ImmA/IrrE family metallo-endopeptidase [Candidatus Obscuribacterales bacterium]